MEISEQPNGKFGSRQVIWLFTFKLKCKQNLRHSEHILRDMGPEIPYPLERTWNQGPGRDLVPEIPYPSPEQIDRHL